MRLTRRAPQGRKSIPNSTTTGGWEEPEVGGGGGVDFPPSSKKIIDIKAGSILLPPPPPLLPQCQVWHRHCLCNKPIVPAIGKQWRKRGPSHPFISASLLVKCAFGPFAGTGGPTRLLDRNSEHDAKCHRVIDDHHVQGVLLCSLVGSCVQYLCAIQERLVA